MAVPDDALGEPTPSERYTVGDLLEMAGVVALDEIGLAGRVPE